LARRHAERATATVQRRDPLLQDVGRGVHDTRVDVSRFR
jgi:hypothetical protein